MCWKERSARYLFGSCRFRKTQLGVWASRVDGEDESSVEAGSQADLLMRLLVGSLSWSRHVVDGTVETTPQSSTIGAVESGVTVSFSGEKVCFAAQVENSGA